MGSIYNNNSRISDKILKFFIYLCAAFSVLVLLSIIVTVVIRGLPSINLEFLTDTQSTLRGTFGILGNLINTLYIIVITLLIVTPIGVGGAIYLNEYANGGKLVNAIQFTIETLAGIPSIIFGLFGMVIFGEFLGLGYSILTGALTLSLMILPIISSSTQVALKEVPESYRQGAIGIGATKWYMIRTIILPSALPGIITGIVLGIGRIVGESCGIIIYCWK